MIRLIFLLILLTLIGALGLWGYSHIANLEPERQEITVPITTTSDG